MMKITILGAALAAAALAGCAHAPAPTAASVAITVTQDQAPARVLAERGLSAMACGIEAAAPTTAKDRLTQANRLAQAYSVIKVGRAGFAASGLPGSVELTLAVAQADADYARVMAELTPS